VVRGAKTDAAVGSEYVESIGVGALKQNRAVTRGAGPRAREARLIKDFTDGRSRSGHDGGEVSC